MHYDVVLVGFRLNATLKPAQALERILGLDAETATRLTKRFPARVLTGVSREEAERAAHALVGAGAKTNVVPSSAHVQPPKAAPSQVATPPQAAAPSQVASPPQARGGHPPQERLPKPKPKSPAISEYQLGDILAPGAAQATPPATELALESALDMVSENAGQAPLRASAVDLFHEPRPDNSNRELAPAPPQAPATPAHLPTGAPDSLGASFGGMRDLGDGLDAFDDQAPALDLDPAALRAAQSPPQPSRRRAARPRPLTPRQKLRAWASKLARSVGAWLLALLVLVLVNGLTLAVVAYAINPHDMLGALGLDTLRQAFSASPADLGVFDE